MDIIYFIFFCILNFFLILIMYFYFNNKYNTKNILSYESVNELLVMNISLYFAVFIKEKIRLLINSHDVNKDSQTNSSKSLYNDMDEIYKAAVKDIILNYISQTHMKSIKLYFTEHSLHNFLLYKLREEL